MACLAGIRKSDENLLKTSCKIAPVTKVAHIFWWRHDNRKQSAIAREHWCDITEVKLRKYLGMLEVQSPVYHDKLRKSIGLNK